MLQATRTLYSLTRWTHQLQRSSVTLGSCNRYPTTAAIQRESSFIKAAAVSTTPHQSTQPHQQSSEDQDECHKRIKPYSEIPTPKRFPIFNFSRDFTKVAKNPFKVVNLIKERVEEFGKIYREKLSPGLPEFLFVLDPSDIEKVFRTGGKYPRRFPITEWITARKQVGIPGGVFLIEGEEWHSQRIPISKYMMMPRKVAEYHEAFNDVALDLIKAIEREKPQDSDILLDTPSVLFRWSLESISMFVLGKRLGCLEEQMPPDCKEYIDSLQDVFVVTQDLLFNLPFHKIWPTKNWRRMVECMDRTGKISMGHIKEKLAEIKEENAELVAKGEEVPAGVDFITYMVHEGKMDLQKITSNAIDLIGAGLDTTSYTLLWCLYSLATNPEVQDKLRSEVNHVVGSKKTVTPTHISNIPYLRDCIKETQRLYPIAPNNTRILDEEVILSGYRVPAGTQVIMPLTVSGTLKEFYQEPERFMPERWNRDNKNTPNAFSSLPFGYGPRMCVGHRVAKLELYIGLAQLVRRFKFEYGEEAPMNYEQRLFLVPERQLNIGFVDIKN